MNQLRNSGSLVSLNNYGTNNGVLPMLGVSNTSFHSLRGRHNQINHQSSGLNLSPKNPMATSNQNPVTTGFMSQLYNSNHSSGNMSGTVGFRPMINQNHFAMQQA